MPKIIRPYYTIETPINGDKILKDLERYGRTCYKSEAKITAESAINFIRNIIMKSGHESVIEHHSITVRFICDRGVTHEIVRHRLASYSQESTRYCNYAKGELGSKITVINPFFFSPDAMRIPVKVPARPWVVDSLLPNVESQVMPFNEFDIWLMTMNFIEWAYMTLINDFGRAPQEARSVLPNSLKTEIVVTYNLREWRHFFKLRTSPKAHPQMRELTIPLLKEFQEKIPVIFEDIKVD